MIPIPGTRFFFYFIYTHSNLNQRPEFPISQYYYQLNMNKNLPLIIVLAW